LIWEILLTINHKQLLLKQEDVLFTKIKKTQFMY
jgi:hypothetical protein